MSSVSSHDGSDKDSLRHKTPTDGSSLPPRYAALRKTDLLDVMDSLGRTNRSGDTDSWSVAATIATIDDQESVASTPGNGNGNGGGGGGLVIVSSTTMDDMVSLDIKVPNNNSDMGNSDDDRQSRSNAAEFGDGGTRSTGSDFEQQQQQQQQQQKQITNDVNDSMATPPMTKSYVELLEENDMLQTQIDNLHSMRKHQSQVIEHLRSLNECSEKTMQLTYNQPQQQQQQHDDDDEDEDTTITTLLGRLYERLHHFVSITVDLAWQPSLEHDLFSLITDAYLVCLPFGTNHQQLLNTAYRDQLWRFQSTLGASFATWYRRQTVQSLSLNPATKEHLDQLQHQLTLQLTTLLQQRDTTTMDQGIWMEILHWCRVLALKLHGDQADVLIQSISPGIDFDPHRMVAMVPSGTFYIQQDLPTQNKMVKHVLSPLFIDEDDQVLLTARVILSDD